VGSRTEKNASLRSANRNEILQDFRSGSVIPIKSGYEKMKKKETTEFSEIYSENSWKISS
jgi:hypothetical protein